MSTRPFLIMLVGLPGAGKSTWVEKARGWIAPFEVVSTDAYVEDWAEKVGKTYTEVFPEVIGEATKRVEARVRELIAKYKNVVWDQTNLTVKTRRQKLAIFPDYYRKTALVIPTPDYELWRQRLASRPGKVIPPDVLDRMIESFVEPTRDEGFDEIW